MGLITLEVREVEGTYGTLYSLVKFVDGIEVESYPLTGKLAAENAQREIDALKRPVIITMENPPGGGYWVDENGEPLRWIPTLTIYPVSDDETQT